MRKRFDIPFKRLPLGVALAALPFGLPAAELTLPELVVRGVAQPAAVSGDELRAARAATSDTARLLGDIPGLSLEGGGGVSSRPAIHGLADDRLRIRLDGMDLISTCPNHMNTPLSYLDPSAVQTVDVYAGISPVSLGGDSIGGTLVVDTGAPRFAEPGQGSIFAAEMGGFYRSNGDGRGGNLALAYGTESLSLSYAGAVAAADDYEAGGDFKKFTLTSTVSSYRPRLDGDEVGSSAYETRNHLLGVALKGGAHRVEVKLGYQDAPEQLFPNQRMDMTDNEQWRVNLHYVGGLAWGRLEARYYHEEVDHDMNFADDKQFLYGTVAGRPVAGMPMRTESAMDGASLEAEFELNPRDLLRLGAEGQAYRLDDHWPPSPDCGTCAGMMAPTTFLNIDDGERDRIGVYAEWEAAWDTAWKTLAGVRYERVESDTGDVQGYNAMMYTGSGVGTLTAWNALDREREDDNFDVTLLARQTPDDRLSFEYGFARKSRSPNLYERYAWSTVAMAMEMNNLAGDGNGYVGNPFLDPEVAYTLSLSADLHSEDRSYEFRVTPFFTYVDDYIDAVRLNVPTDPTNLTRTTGFVLLTYANEEARLYGVDVSGRMPLAKSRLGEFGLKGLLSFTKGENVDTDDGLYNIMPLNAKLALTHKAGGWDNALELVMVDAKEDVSDVRNELETPAYSLVGLRGSYSVKKLRLDFGIENLLDHKYYLPLGGAYLGEGATMAFNKEVGTIAAGMMGISGDQSVWGTAVPGPGRTFYVGLNYRF